MVAGPAPIFAMPVADLLRQIPLELPDPERLRDSIRQAFHVTFDSYESLFTLLRNDEAYLRKPIALRHPLIFYLGHTATFFINKFVLAGIDSRRVDARLESMFAVGVDEMSWDDLDDRQYAWPRVEDVWAYRTKVREHVDTVLDRLPLNGPVGWDSPWWVVLMGIEHERIHLETSSVLIRQQKLDLVCANAAWAPCRETGDAPVPEFVDIPPLRFRLGRERADPGCYGWDNEFGEHQASTDAFRAGRYLVSNHEFLAFVTDGGYQNDRYWTEEGLAWKRFAKVEHPEFWIRHADGWRLRLLAEETPMPWDWPVETNAHEAKAFCNWMASETGLGIRLPGEDEWHALRIHAGVPDGVREPLPKAQIGLAQQASSCPVTRHAHGPLCDVVGNVWQWCETPMHPFAGFAVHPAYDDFTTPTFDGRHALIKGGSWISCGNLAEPASRYAFRSHFFQHAGFRYVAAERPPSMPRLSRYEDDAQVAQYCEFHWGDTFFEVPNFPKALAHLCVQAMEGRPMHRALDLGCATGRATFELARSFQQVTGIDFSARFISVGDRLLRDGCIRYTVIDEGELVGYREHTLAEHGLQAFGSRVTFFQGDACNLRTVFTGYDLVLAANLIDRLDNPRLFLQEIHRRINRGGLLVIASPCTWLEEHTPRANWIGGFKQDGESFTTLDGLHALLDANFEQFGPAHNVPFVIRETRRKFQHTVSEVTIWSRR